MVECPDDSKGSRRDVSPSHFPLPGNTVLRIRVGFFVSLRNGSCQVGPVSSREPATDPVRQTTDVSWTVSRSRVVDDPFVRVRGRGLVSGGGFGVDVCGRLEMGGTGGHGKVVGEHGPLQGTYVFKQLAPQDLYRPPVVFSFLPSYSQGQAH